ncbi:MAG: DNA translocase FtsK [Candidatus Eisenbacteria bacterium]|nr:DNA translocase FtsK [Candidatus Eisenbacteria bacterium]
MGKRSSGTYSFVTGALLLVAGVMLLSSLVSYHEEDIGLLAEHEGNVANAFGLLGVRIAQGFLSAFGLIFPWFIGIFLLAWSWNRFARNPAGKLWLQTLFSLGLIWILTVSLALLPGLSRVGDRRLAGQFGLEIADRGHSLLGSFGAPVVSWCVLVILFLVGLETGLLPGLKALSFLRRLGLLAGSIANALITKVAAFVDERARRTKISRSEERPVERKARGPVRASEPSRAKIPAEPRITPPSSEPRLAAQMRIPAAAESNQRSTSLFPATRESRAGEPPTREAEFSLPSLSLLDDPSGPETYMSKEELLESSKMIEEKLANFDVTGRVTEVHPGPVITRFDFEPGPSITVNQIASRAEDLALGLKVSRIRLLTPVPGKAAVGIEVPNRVPSIVYIKELLSSDAFRKQEGRLVLALGKDALGGCFYTELSRMPHLLIAGATGSGKSVCISSIILSLLYRLSPKELNLLMIDPKKLELTAYNGTPHLVMPVISDAREASRSLRWVVKEMERRYHVLAAKAVRNIDSFNERVREEGAEELPYLVVIIDELADLMCMLPTEIEEPISRLAQMARAVGIHLILATQRPSVDVITGVIKANFPTRLAFQVASKVDSRTILDMNGAEALLGSGDMLFLPAGRAEPERLHGSYVSEKDIERVVSHLKNYSWMARPFVDLTESIAADGGEAGAEDELLEDAARVVITHRHGSVSLLQRRLKVGYSRAARLMDRLEEIGVVGPADGSKPRDVLVNDSFLDQGGLFEKESQSPRPS